CAVLADAAAAQQARAESASARIQQVSDALILIAPQANQALLSITYPHTVPHTAVRERLQRLARAEGWTLDQVEVKDEDVTTSPGFGPTRPLGKQTGATALIGGAPLTRDNAFPLQPFVDCF